MYGSVVVVDLAGDAEVAEPESPEAGVTELAADIRVRFGARACTAAMTSFVLVGSADRSRLSACRASLRHTRV
jgi:hypothetical protein